MKKHGIYINIADGKVQRYCCDSHRREAEDKLFDGRRSKPEAEKESAEKP